MHKSQFLLVAPFSGVLLRRSVAYWVLLHLMRAIAIVWAVALSRVPLQPVDLLPAANPFVPILVVGLGMLQARRSDEDLYLANLGYGWPIIAAYLMAPAAALQTVFVVGRMAA